MLSRSAVLLVVTLLGCVYSVNGTARLEPWQHSSYLQYTHPTVPAYNLSSYRGPQGAYGAPVLRRVPGYGARRFLAFPNGTEFNVTLKFGMPVRGIGSLSILAVQHVIVFRPPTFPSGYVFGRSLPAVEDRLDFYGHFESFLSGFGLDGHACALRAICEIAEMPFDHGLLGEAINHVFSMMSFSEASVSEDKYLQAEQHGRYHGQHPGQQREQHHGQHRGQHRGQHHGHRHGGCAALYPECSVSVADLISCII